LIFLIDLVILFSLIFYTGVFFVILYGKVQTNLTLTNIRTNIRLALTWPFLAVTEDKETVSLVMSTLKMTVKEVTNSVDNVETEITQQEVSQQEVSQQEVSQQEVSQETIIEKKFEKQQENDKLKKELSHKNGIYI
jgi:hypothetical protein